MLKVDSVGETPTGATGTVALPFSFAKSLFGNYEGRCGEGFWLWPRRRVPSMPAAGCKERANAGHGQKSRRPEGFRGKSRLASLLLSRRSTRDILLRRASPSGLFPENSAPRSFQTGSYNQNLDPETSVSIASTDQISHSERFDKPLAQNGLRLCLS